jgi:hypothetical protein
VNRPEVESVEYVVSRDGHDVDWYQDREEALARGRAEKEADPGQPWRVTKRVTYCCDVVVIFGDPEEDEEA